MIKETKICTKCGIEKKSCEYGIRTIKGQKYLRPYCKKCACIMAKNYTKTHPQEIIERRKEYYKKNREKSLKRSKEYREKNKKEILKREAIYRNKNKKKRNMQNREYYQKHKKELQKKSYLRYKKRKENDSLYKLKDQTRRMIKDVFRRKKYKKNSRTEAILGCNYDVFINYLLQTFKNNYGYEWNGTEKIAIDHIVPLASAKTEEEVIKLNHYTNLQLLKAEDNLHKGAKLDWRLDDVK